MKRALDFFLSFCGLILASPVLLPVMFLVWRQDGNSPFYVASRIGVDGREFRMIKLRSMVVGADKSGVDSTSTNDARITTIGRFIRAYKLDEITQLWNVLKGDMSLVGPRPNVKRETDIYTMVEKRLLTVRPGVTDFASIVFSDEGEILSNKEDPDLAYNQLIRPWKSSLGLFYIDNRSLWSDIKLVACTAIAIISRKRALNLLVQELITLGAPQDLVRLAHREDELLPYPPPGADKIVSSR